MSEGHPYRVRTWRDVPPPRYEDDGAVGTYRSGRAGLVVSRSTESIPAPSGPPLPGERCPAPSWPHRSERTIRCSSSTDSHARASPRRAPTRSSMTRHRLRRAGSRVGRHEPVHAGPGPPPRPRTGVRLDGRALRRLAGENDRRPRAHTPRRHRTRPRHERPPGECVARPPGAPGRLPRRADRGRREARAPGWVARPSASRCARAKRSRSSCPARSPVAMARRAPPGPGSPRPRGRRPARCWRVAAERPVPGPPTGTRGRRCPDEREER